jgi:hypothetical protein
MLQMQSKMMAFAVSKEDGAVRHIQLGPRSPEVQLPAAPVWMQMVHLLLADLVWLSLVLLCAGMLEDPTTKP